MIKTPTHWQNLASTHSKDNPVQWTTLKREHGVTVNNEGVYLDATDETLRFAFAFEMGTYWLRTQALWFTYDPQSGYIKIHVKTPQGLTDCAVLSIEPAIQEYLERRYADESL